MTGFIIGIGLGISFGFTFFSSYWISYPKDSFELEALSSSNLHFCNSPSSSLNHFTKILHPASNSPDPYLFLGISFGGDSLHSFLISTFGCSSTTWFYSTSIGVFGTSIQLFFDADNASNTSLYPSHWSLWTKKFFLFLKISTMLSTNYFIFCLFWTSNS